MMKNNSYKNKNINQRVVCILCYFFRASPLPVDIQVDMMSILKQIISSSDDIFYSEGIRSIAFLAECQSNHSILLSEDIITDIVTLLQDHRNQTSRNLKSLTFILGILIQEGNEETRNTVRNIIPIDVIRQLTKHSDKTVILNMTELLSWILIPDLMKKLFNLQQDLKQMKVEERSIIAEQGILNELCEILKKIGDCEEEMSGVICPVCEVLSLMIGGNPQLIPEVFENDGIVDQLLIHIKNSSINELYYIQMETLRVIVNECNDDQLRELFSRGAVKASRIQLDNKESRSQSKSAEIIERIIEAGSSDIKYGEPNRFRDEIIQDQILQQLVSLFFNNDVINIIKDNIALSISFLYKANQIPQEYNTQIIDHLKTLSRNGDEDVSSRTIKALTNLAECNSNQQLILSNEFADEIAQHIRNKQKQQNCLQSLHLAFMIYLHGSEDNKIVLKSAVTVTLARQASFCKKKKTAQAKNIKYDIDKQKSIKARQLMMERASKEGFAVSGVHTLFPGTGYVKKNEENGYTFIPIQ
ncbi:MAG: hypothetical protein EZS28_027068 [Streblomastix strix]|uniref:Uncharacterized protein n=1 Tax=Streblomastix strix TaxID=222440 RepID=A0A5J4V5K1_9EUKA|nr:MAG: hypothetical protein EZS28_027068 [Streblomastix strix]